MNIGTLAIKIRFNLIASNAGRGSCNGNWNQNPTSFPGSSSAIRDAFVDMATVGGDQLRHFHGPCSSSSLP